MNPELNRDCECCWMESDECQIFRLTNEWLCPDCYIHAKKIEKKLRDDTQ